eukprot:2337624-Prymnesium_polylepis.2
MSASAAWYPRVDLPSTRSLLLGNFNRGIFGMFVICACRWADALLPQRPCKGRRSGAVQRLSGGISPRGGCSGDMCKGRGRVSGSTAAGSGKASGPRGVGAPRWPQSRAAAPGSAS